MRLGAIGYVLVLALGIGLGSPVDRAEVEIEVVDAFGHSLRYGVTGVLYSEGKIVAKVTGGAPLRMNNVPYGQYRLIIDCPGARTVSRTVSISERAATVRVGLPLAKVGDPEPGELVLVGRVVPCQHRAALWVKVVGAFTDEAVVVRIPASCEFRIPNLTGGRYVGFLTTENTVKDMKTFDLTVGSGIVIFEAR